MGRGSIFSLKFCLHIQFPFSMTKWSFFYIQKSTIYLWIIKSEILENIALTNLERDEMVTLTVMHLDTLWKPLYFLQCWIHKKQTKNVVKTTAIKLFLVTFLLFKEGRRQICINKLTSLYYYYFFLFYIFPLKILPPSGFPPTAHTVQNT